MTTTPNHDTVGGEQPPALPPTWTSTAVAPPAPAEVPDDAMAWRMDFKLGREDLVAVYWTGPEWWVVRGTGDEREVIGHTYRGDRARELLECECYG